MKKLTFSIALLFMIVGTSYSQNSSGPEGSPGNTIAAEEYFHQGSNKDACSFLVFRDNLPWGSSAVTDILTGNEETFTVANSSQMAPLDFSTFDVIIIESDQITGFYTNFEASFPKFDAFVNSGGRLEVHSATCGWNSPCGYSIQLPGGPYTTELMDDYNVIAMPAHPIVVGVSNPFFGSSASHGYFSNLAPGTDIITTSQINGSPTTIQYSWGQGTVTATTCTYEYGYIYSEEAGEMLVNNLNYSCSGYIPPNPPSVPLSDWAIYFAIMLIGIGIYYRFKTRIA